jgi:hypothetical protein
MNRRDFLTRAAATGGLAFPMELQPASAPGAPLARRMTAVHTMVDMPEWCRDTGKHWDSEAFVRACQAAGAGVIELKTKNAMGHAAFPFRDRPCPADWTTRTRQLARREGIPFIAYYNVGLDNWMARQRPEWRCLDPAGKEKIAFGAFNWMCLRSPWRDVVLSEIRQVAEAIRPDGFWFDLLGAPNAYGAGSFDPSQACFCPYCREAYRKRFGAEQPVASADPEVRLRVNRFGHQARIAMLRDAVNLLLSIDRRMVLGYNGAGIRDLLSGTPKDIQARVGLHSTEAKPHRLISFTAKSMWAMRKPYQVHSYGGFMTMQPGSAVGTWSAWNLIPSSYMRVSAAVATAHGGRISVGINPLPDGTFYPGEFSNLARTFQAVKEREPWLAGLESVPSVALVYDPKSELCLLPLPGQTGLPVQQETIGLHNALLDGGVHFDVVSPEWLEPSQYRALLIGNAVCPPPALLEALRSYVAAGGLLIVTHETSLGDGRGQRREDFSWADLLGVRFTGISPFKEANYLWLGDELRGDAPAYPLLFRSEVLEIRCTSARALGELVYPEGHRTRDQFTDGETPYTHFKTFTHKPLVTLNRLGKGSVIYIAGPVGREIAAREDPWLKRLVTSAIRKYAPPLAIDATVPAGVQVVFGRKDNGATHVVSLVNLFAGMAFSADASPTPRVGPVKLTIPLDVFPSRPGSVQSIDAEGVQWTAGPKALEIAIASIGHHAVLAVT